MGRHGAEAVVPGEPAAAARLQAARLEVDLVVDDENRVGLKLVEASGGADRPARFVHERLRLEQADTVFVHADLGDPAGELALPRAAVPPGELVDDHPA